VPTAQAYRLDHLGSSETEGAVVTFINTDGMALIGPGSEWFWTALQFTALAITFIAIYRQLQGQHTQMQENTKLLRSQAHHNALTLSQRARELLIENESFAHVVHVGYATPEALSAVDWARCSSYMFLQFNQWEYLYYQHRDDSIPIEYWVGAEDYYRNLIAASPGYARFWSGNQSSFDEPFRSYAARAFSKTPATTPVA
jgi:hypothetical protein